MNDVLIWIDDEIKSIHENNLFRYLTEIQSGQMAGWYEPLAVVRWIRDQIGESGKELQPGQILSLGNIGIIRQLHEGSPRGPAYTSTQFRLEYYGLTDEPPVVIINVDR